MGCSIVIAEIPSCSDDLYSKNGQHLDFGLGINSPGPLMDDWKVTDYSSINFHDVFYFIFCQIIAENEEKLVMEIYG